MAKRSDIDVKYTWDLTHIFKTENEFEKAYKRVRELYNKIPEFRGKLNNKKDVLEEMKIETELGMLLERMEVYLLLKKEMNGKDVHTLEQLSDLENYLTDMASKTSFVISEMAKLSDDFIDDLISDPSFIDYNKSLRDLKDDRKHILDEQREQMLTKISSFAGFSEIFSKLDDIELKFENIILDDGSEVCLSNQNYSIFAHDKSQNVRKQAFEKIHKGYKNVNLTLSENFINFLKYCDVMSEFRNYDDTVSRCLFNSRIKRKVVDSLIKNVHDNLPLFFKYVKYLKEALLLKDFNNADLYAPLSTNGNNIQYTFEEAKEIVKKALKPLGVNYLNIVDVLFENRTIDVYPTENKGGGGFSVSAYGCLPYILLNYNNGYRDMSTLAHEMGHSMHSYLSNHRQCYEKANYDIFVAEIASTVNEILLFRYMELNAKSDDERRFLIANFLSEFYATIFRQTMFTEFELFAHDSTKKRIPLSFEKLNSKYQELRKQYFGNDVKLLENGDVEWSRIPHFYRPFYVYKYATGMISACAIVSNILKRGEDYVNNYYMEFLSAGGSLDPIDILKLADVDIADKSTFDGAFAFYNEYIEKFKKL